MQNFVTVSHTVCMVKKFLARWYSVFSGLGAWLTTRNTFVLH